MQIIIYTLDFLKTRPLVDLIEFTFKYGTKQTRNPSIFVGTPSDGVFESPPSDDSFIFIFYHVDVDDVKSGLDIMSRLYENTRRKFFLVMTQEQGLTYESLGLTQPDPSFRRTYFLQSDSSTFSDYMMVNFLKDIIQSQDL